MESDTNGQKFNCNICNHKTMVIYRWEDNSPLGVCHNCMAARELNTEELDMIINKRVCDRPGCGKDIPEGTGSVLEAGVFGLDEETREPLVKWDLCSECVEFFDELFNSGGVTLKKLFGSYRRSKGLTESWKNKKDTEEVPIPE